MVPGEWPIWGDVILASICASFSAVAFMVAMRVKSRQILYWAMSGELMTVVLTCYVLLAAPDARVRPETLFAVLRICRVALAILIPVAINDAIGLHHGRISAMQKRLHWWSKWEEHD